MKTGKAPYSLQKRPANRNEAEKKRQGKPYRYIFYVQFRDGDGNYTSALSTNATSEGAARAWAKNYMSKGNVPTHRGYTFELFAKDWWIPGKCRYLKEKEQSGHALSARYIVESRRNLEKRLIPHFGSMKLTSIRYKDIWDWKNNLYEEGKLNPATINRSLATLKVMFKQAVREEYVQYNPCAEIGILRETPRPKTILSPEEAQKLFSPRAIAEVWGGHLIFFCMNLLAATTGMRLGEIKALQRQDIRDGFAEVRHSWSDKIGLKDTKTHTERFVPLLETVKRHLNQLMAKSANVDPDAFVFGREGSGHPYTTKEVDDALYAALEKIEITNEERTGRNIVFHSWRYFFNSLCQSRGVPDSVTRMVMGHTTPAMTMLYTSFPKSELNAVLALDDVVFAKKSKQKSSEVKALEVTFKKGEPVRRTGK